MCEMLVRVVDRTNSDFYKDCKCTKTGDVIVVVEDSWLWTKEERTSEEWRIIACADMKMSEAELFTSSEVPESRELQSKTLQFRAFKIDLTLLPDTEAFIGRRKNEIEYVDRETLLFSRAQKPAIKDPAIIGEAESVIG